MPSFNIIVREEKFVYQYYDPGDHLKRCRSPDLEKCRKSASESADPKRGAEGSAEKSAPGSVSLCKSSIGDGTRSTNLSTSLGDPFRAGTFRSTFSALFQVGVSAPLQMVARVVIPVPDPPKKMMGKKSPVRMILLIFPGKSYGPWEVAYI